MKFPGCTTTMTNILMLIAFCCTFTLGWLHSAISDEVQPANQLKSDEKGLTLTSNAVFVKGFPVVLKLNAKGPQSVPIITLFSWLAAIQFTLVSKDNQKQYTIASMNPGYGMTLIGPGGMMMTAEHRYMTSVWPGEERTTLLDLASLRPRGANTVALKGIPPGKYTVAVTEPKAISDTTSTPLPNTPATPNKNGNVNSPPDPPQYRQVPTSILRAVTFDAFQYSAKDSFRLIVGGFLTLLEQSQNRHFSPRAV